MKISHLLLLSVLFVLAPVSTVAEEQKYLRGLNISVGYFDQQFVELNDQGEPLLEETGAITFVGGGFYWQTRSGLFAEISYRESSDTVDYSGLTQQGRFVQTNTELYLEDTTFLFGRNFGQTSAFIGVGRSFRERNILGTENISGLYEEIEHTNAMFGLRANLFPHRRFQIRLEARVWTDIDSSFYVSMDGKADPLTFEPGKSFGHHTSAEFFFDIGRDGGFTISLIPAFEYTHMDKSREYPLYLNGAPLYLNQHQPEMEWESYSLTGKIAWYF
ncbi:hypothetical protein DWB84_11775 [Saccharophagus sp. K07]|jgi:hypothetical protein|uniref:hypothetical protein n=1 Tax=Saccharophagus sp. K07 TaxID=2283636 RepID=UPI0016521015|nr:hypothetical protein [Saccharophagus sp. K07]MBC6906139.1 hypothetical protein [Saccharophagus sp. K07]